MMRDLLVRRVAPGVSSFCLVSGVVLTAAAQAPAPAVAPVPAAASPAPLAAPPPPPPPPRAPLGAAPLTYPGYPPPPPQGYGYQQPFDGRGRRWSGDESVTYQGGPIPSGYHLEERPRRGLLIAGPIILGVPYVIGLSVAGGQNFPNGSGWLIVPGIGPWLTLAARHKSSCSTSYGSCDDSGVDDATRTGLILDGLMQTGGAIMFIAGLAYPRQVVARDFVGSLHWAPGAVGRAGYGGFVWGAF